MKKRLLLGCLLALCACGSDDDDKPKIKDEDKAAKVAKIKTDDLICPQTAILKAAQQIADYGGEKPDPSQLVAQAKMQSVEGDCGYEDNGIDIAFTLHMKASRGKRLGSNTSFPYFIAIVDPAEKIISRQSMTAHFSFDGGDKVATSDEELHVFIPVAKTMQISGPDYRVLVGFKQPRGQSH